MIAPLANISAAWHGKVFRQRLLRSLIAVLCVLLIVGVSSGGNTQIAEARTKPVEDLVGVIMQKREVATLLVLRHKGGLWLPLAEFADLTKMELPQAGNQTLRSVRTPIGEATLPSSALFNHAGITYVDSNYLKSELNFVIKDRKDQMAVAVITPWSRPGRGDRPEFDRSALEPEVLPPEYGIATVHGSMSVQTTDDDKNVYDNTFRMTGFALDGVWQFSYDEDLIGDRKIRDGIWMKQMSPGGLVQIGHQSIALHPLLNVQEMTGVQYAWSSKPITMSGTSFYPGALMTRRGARQRTFAGRGPIGGWAELWVDGLLISRRDIKLDGTYEFDDIPLASRQAQIEIRIYDHHQPDTPSEVISETIELSDLLLDAGQATVLASGGLRGNAYDVLGRDTQFGGGVAGVAFARWGLNDGITLEGAVDLTDDSQRVMGGVVAQLYRGVFGTLALAGDQAGKIGYDAELSVQKGRWQLMLNSFRALSIGKGETTSEQEEPTHTGHVSYSFSRALEIGLLSRYDDETGYGLPYAYWLPNQYTTVRIRPDRAGDYGLDASYRHTPVDSFTLSADYEYAALSYSHLFSSGLIMSVRTGYDYDEKSPDLRVSLAGNGLLGIDMSWRAAALTSDEFKLGFEVSLRKELREGVYGYVDAASHHNKRERSGSVFGDRDDLRLRFGVSFDLAYSKSGLTKANYGGVRPNVGNLAGVVAPTAKGSDLSGIPILIDGQYRGRTAADGSFFVAGVEKGNHVIEIEDDSLPLEHVPSKRSIVAKVAPGAVTSLTFDTKVFYGAAGQVVTPNGEGAGNLAIAVFDNSGKQVGESLTNDFGYYRVDNLAVGAYRVDVTNEDGKAISSRKFAITDDYAFDLNLKVPAQSQKKETK